MRVDPWHLLLICRDQVGHAMSSCLMTCLRSQLPLKIVSHQQIVFLWLTKGTKVQARWEMLIFINFRLVLEMIELAFAFRGRSQVEVMIFRNFVSFNAVRGPSLDSVRCYVYHSLFADDLLCLSLD